MWKSGSRNDGAAKEKAAAAIGGRVLPEVQNSALQVSGVLLGVSLALPARSDPTLRFFMWRPQSNRVLSEPNVATLL